MIAPQNQFIACELLMYSRSYFRDMGHRIKWSIIHFVQRREQLCVTDVERKMGSDVGNKQKVDLMTLGPSLCQSFDRALYT